MGINLQDSEILKIREIQLSLNRRFSLKPRSPEIIDEIEKEAVEALYHMGFIAHVDAFPILQGEEMTISLVERADPDLIFDHEHKQYDVNKAREKGETLHGESGSSG